MAGVMESLAMGLRGAGGILSPTAFKAGVEEDSAQAAERRRIELMQLQEQMAGAKEKLLSDAVAPSLMEGNFEKAAAAAANSGAPGGTKLAMELLSKSEERKARVLMADQALEAKKAALQQAHEEKMSRLATDEAKASELARHNTTMEVFRARELELSAGLKRMGYDLQAERQERQSQQQLNVQVQKLGGALEKAGLPEIDIVLKQVDDALGKEPDRRKELASYIAGDNAWKLDRFIGQDERDAKQAATKLFNITLKNRSGTAVTNQELDRLKQEFATGVWKTPEQFLNGLEKARKIINQHYSAVAAGFGPDALKAYNENIRGFGGRVVIESKGSGEDPLGIR